MRNNNSLIPWGGKDSLWPSDLLGNFFGDSFFPSVSSGMKADIRETEKNYVIDVEVPGINRDNLEIDLTDNYLTITAHLDESSEEKGKNGQYLRRERKTGVFRRSFALENVKTEEITAQLINGVLSVTCPKSELPAEQKKKIDIQ